MKPVDQTKLWTKDGIHSGNCLAACFASLLEIPLWMVPPFEEMFGRNEWQPRITEWCAKMFKVNRIYTEGHQPDLLPEFYIACGLSLRGVDHACIYSRGELVHDPHPSRTGVRQIKFTYHLEPLEP